MKSVSDLVVWEQAQALTMATCRGTAGIPQQATYDLTSQIRRCAASIAANIAEGCGKRSNAEFPAVLAYCRRISQRTRIPLYSTKILVFLCDEEYMDLVQSIVEGKRMLAGLIRLRRWTRIGGLLIAEC
jgi:four helix bundle protein